MTNRARRFGRWRTKARQGISVTIKKNQIRKEPCGVFKDEEKTCIPSAVWLHALQLETQEFLKEPEK